MSRVKGDTVFMYINNYQTDKATGIDDLKDKGYAASEDTTTIAGLQDMDVKNQILDIERR